jgi:3',5'-cyclic-AMP phosphodiesterase
VSHGSTPAGTSRRNILKTAAGLFGATLLGGSPVRAALSQSAPSTERHRALRIAHLTDIHVQPEAGGGEGMAACLHHAQERFRPDLILNTGDAIRDSMATPEPRVRAFWDLSQRIWKSECSVPVEHAIGNHDIWGINKKASKTTGSEPLYGKKWIMSLHGWERTYRSFDRNGWHFIALDTVSFDTAYHGHVEPEQFEWLEQDLARVSPKTPVLVFGHIPILSAAAYFKHPTAETSGDWKVPQATMIIEARRFKDLFLKHPNVKVCLSGHLHLVDRVDYNGVSYLCGGAVSANRWKGDNQECKPGYNLLDLYTDGTFESQYITYGWKFRT